jgi:hypothetical protein
VRAEGNTAGGVIFESLVGPARSESPGTYAVSMRENRFEHERRRWIGWLMVVPLTAVL